MAKFDTVLFPEVVKGDVFVDPAAADHIVNPEVTVLLESGLCTPFTRTSMVHGRSKEDPRALVLSSAPLADEHGHVYTRFSIKGASVALPSTSRYEIEPSGIRVNGMLDASTFERCQGVSKILRAAGVLTEWPIYHGRPKWFPGGNDEVAQEKDRLNLSAFRRQLYNNYAKDQGERRNYRFRGEDKALMPYDSLAQAEEVWEAISGIQFGVMYRGMMSNVRLSELGILQEQAKDQAHIADAIRALQARQPTHFIAWEELDKLNAESVDDRYSYMNEVLPQIVGENLARFHNTGSYHKYLHGGNITIAGEIVDLDSVRNPSFDPEDAEVFTPENWLGELMHVSRQISAINRFPGNLINLPSLQQFKDAYFSKRLEDENLSEAELQVLEAHLSPLLNLVAEDPGPPYVVQPTSAEIQKLIDDALCAEFNARAVNEDGEDRNYIFAHTLIKALGIFCEPQIADHLKATILDPLPKWINLNLLGTFEGLRIFYEHRAEVSIQQDLARVAMANFL
jgi:hypothetical protein